MIIQQQSKAPKDVLHLMPRDAHTIHVYWNISNRKRWLVAEHFGADWHVMPKVLRVYDVTLVYFNGHNANAYFDISTTPESSSWYVHGVKANVTYVMDYGVYTINHQFIPLIRSNFVTTPRDESEKWGAPIVSVVPEAYRTGRRIRSYFLENFSDYSTYKKRGIHLDDQSDTGETEMQRVSYPSPSQPSALYSPS